MKLRNYFKPVDEIFNSFDYSMQRKITNMILGGIVCAPLFFLLMITCFALEKLIVGAFFLLPFFLFLISLFSIKSGRIYQASYIMNAALLCAMFGPALFSARDYNPVVVYRISCFTMCMSIANYFVSIKKTQLWIFFVIAIVILVLTTIFQYYNAFFSDLREWIAVIVINCVGLFAGNLILITSNRANLEVVRHSQKEQEQAEKTLEKITVLLNKAKESLTIGKKLNDATSQASVSIDRITNLYQELISETNELENQSNHIKESSSIVNSSSKTMTENISKQNQSLGEMSSALTQIASNLSSIDEIAEKRQAGMNEVIKLLDQQSRLIEKLVEEIEQVSASSDSITDFVQTVDSIASQTSLLAMNASIEAAHAGENGKGFSVIAQEIRKLSEETSKNATKIEETLNQNNVAVKETSASVQEVSSATKKSTEEVKQTIESMAEILSGIREMDVGTKDVMKSVNQIVEQAQNNTSVIDNVVNQIGEQAISIANITNSTNSLKERVNSVNEMILTISGALDEFFELSQENENVSSEIAKLLDEK